MTDFSRRRFLRYVGASSFSTLAATLTFDDAALAATATPLAPGTPILVLVTLYGGNDGLNTVVPYLDSVYLSSRPGLSLSGANVLPLANGLALNGTMKGFKSLWDRGNLAIVLGTSYPQPSYSHFTSMAVWQTASPAESTTSGWIGRWLDAQAHNPFTATGIGDVLTPLLAGNKRVGSILPLWGIDVPGGAYGARAEQLSLSSPRDTSLTAKAAESIGDLFTLASTVGPVLANPPPTGTDLAQQLDVVAKLIAANVPTRVYSVTIDGFDTHADELSAQGALVGAVSDAVTAFLARIDATSRAQDVVVMAYSEFGRRVEANDSQGTDHGTSGPVFVAGNRVVGGFFGEQPSLSALVDGDLAVTTDFRDIYASMLADVLGADPQQIMPGWTSKLNLIASG
jgi:uncharacterized protein (DUF1501 family)